MWRPGSGVRSEGRGQVRSDGGVSGAPFARISTGFSPDLDGDGRTEAAEAAEAAYGRRPQLRDASRGVFQYEAGQGVSGCILGHWSRCVIKSNRMHAMSYPRIKRAN